MDERELFNKQCEEFLEEEKKGTALDNIDPNLVYATILVGGMIGVIMLALIRTLGNW